MVYLHEILTSPNLMQHEMRVGIVPDRTAWLLEQCQERTVLHVGCCDVPVFDPNQNLHVDLSRVTDRLDGLDVSEDGIRELARHVHSDYFTAPDQTDKEYDILVAPEVLEHVPNAGDFLAGLFSVRAKTYLITAPDIQWFSQMRREGERVVEAVHGDHKAWYSPYTLLNSVRPHLDQDDDIELFHIDRIGSIAIVINKRRSVEEWERSLDTDPSRSAAQNARSLVEQGETGRALWLLGRARRNDPGSELYVLQTETLLQLGRHLDAFRGSVQFMREHPSDSTCLRLAARASEGLGQHEQAAQLRQMANTSGGGVVAFG